MEPRNPDYRTEIERVFNDAPFISTLGMALSHISPGICHSRIDLAARHLQQDGFVHAGVQATMADHTAGTAAASLMAPGKIVLTAEFKINFLAAAKGEALTCRARVIKPGKRLSVVEAEVCCVSGETEQMTAKALLTMAIVDRPEQ